MYRGLILIPSPFFLLFLFSSFSSAAFCILLLFFPPTCTRTNHPSCHGWNSRRQGWSLYADNDDVNYEGYVAYFMLRSDKSQIIYRMYHDRLVPRHGPIEYQTPLRTQGTAARTPSLILTLPWNTIFLVLGRWWRHPRAAIVRRFDVLPSCCLTSGSFYPCSCEGKINGLHNLLLWMNKFNSVRPRWNITDPFFIPIHCGVNIRGTSDM